MKTTPTTKILAIGTINPDFENRRCLLSYRRKFGKLSTSTSMARSSSGTRCVAFIINVTDPAVAHEMMSFELIHMGPLNPLRFLQGMQPKP